MNTKSLKEQIKEELDAEFRRRFPNGSTSPLSQFRQDAFLDGMEFGMAITMKIISQAMAAGLEPDPTKQ